MKRALSLAILILGVCAFTGVKAAALPVPELLPVTPEESPYVEILRKLKDTYYIVGAFSDGRAYVSIEGNSRYGYVDKTGEVHIPIALAPPDLLADYSYDIFSEGLVGFYAEEADGLWAFGYMDTEGMIRIQPVFEEGGQFYGGLAAICTLEGQYRFIDRDGGFFTEYQPVHCVGRAGSEGLYAIRDQNGLCGYMDANGHVVIAPVYAHAERFSEGLAAVRTSEGLYGYIDTLGKMVIAPQFYEARSFSGGVAAVITEQDRRILEDLMPYSYIDRNGQVVLQSATYVPQSPFGNGGPVPQLLDCGNGILCTYDMVDAPEGTLYASGFTLSNCYNSTGDKADLKTDCAPVLQPYEWMYVGKWEDYDSELWYFESEEIEQGYLYLYRDRTALVVDEETGACVATYTWASMPSLSGVLLQDGSGEIFAVYVY